MADDQRKPWVIPVFFGILVALVWLILDTMKPPQTAVAAAPVDDSPPAASAAEPVSASAGAAEQLSTTVR